MCGTWTLLFPALPPLGPVGGWMEQCILSQWGGCDALELPMAMSYHSELCSQGSFSFPAAHTFDQLPQLLIIWKSVLRLFRAQIPVGY